MFYNLQNPRNLSGKDDFFFSHAQVHLSPVVWAVPHFHTMTPFSPVRQQSNLTVGVQLYNGDSSIYCTANTNFALLQQVHCKLDCSLSLFRALQHPLRSLLPACLIQVNAISLPQLL